MLYTQHMHAPLYDNNSHRIQRSNPLITLDPSNLFLTPMVVTLFNLIIILHRIAKYPLTVSGNEPQGPSRVENFEYLKRFVPDSNMQSLLMRKDIFPYSFFSRQLILNDTQLPNKEAFTNDLDGSTITPEDYGHTQQVWHGFRCQTFRDYIDLYLLCDVLQLADVFESFRAKCIADYNLHPVYYFSSPHFTYDAFLRYSGVK